MLRVFLVVLGTDVVAATSTPTLISTAQEYPADKPARLTKSTLAAPSSTPAPGVPVLRVDLAKKRQTIEGFGGAITDAVASVFAQLNDDKQEEVLEAFWGPSGQHYNLARLTIGSTDFSTGIYNYNEPDGTPRATPDFNQSSFSIKHDTKQIIPLVLRAQAKAAAAAAARGDADGLRCLSSSWSPPGWMKAGYLHAKGFMRNSAKPGMLDDPRMYESYALYLSKYVSAYAAAGVHIDKMTIQNEPDSADHMVGATYPACNFNGTGEGSFLKDHLGPRMRTDHPDLKIFVHDGQKFHDVPILDRVDAIIAAAGGDFGFIDGVAFHWYGNNLANYQYLAALHAKYPDLALLATEATLQAPATQLDPWSEAQKYAVDIIGDLNNGARGWIEWNVLLNTKGGPTCIGPTSTKVCTPAIGHCDAPILADTGAQTLEYRDSFWVMGHFSRYLPRGSTVVDISGSAAATVNFTAAVTPANQLVVVVVNTDKKGRQIEKNMARYQLEINGQYVATPPLPGYGVQTVIMDL
eukprot:g3146.t1